MFGSGMTGFYHSCNRPGEKYTSNVFALEYRCVCVCVRTFHSPDDEGHEGGQAQRGGGAIHRGGVESAQNQQEQEQTGVEPHLSAVTDRINRVGEGQVQRSQSSHGGGGEGGGYSV